MGKYNRRRASQQVHRDDGRSRDFSGDVDASGGTRLDVAMVGGEASARLKLFFVFKTVQLIGFLILADLVSARIFIAIKFFSKLLFKPKMIDCSDVHIVCGSGDGHTVL